MRMKVVTIAMWLMLASFVGLVTFAPVFGFTRGQAVAMDVKAAPSWIILVAVRAAYLSRLSATTGEKR